MSKAKDDNDRLMAGELPADPDADTVPVVSTSKASPRRIFDLAQAGLELSDKRNRGEEPPVPVPWEDYSRLLGGGLWPGMHVLVGGTGAGKTTWTTQIAIEAASKGFPVAYVGLELDEAQIGLRVLGEHAGVGWSKLYLGNRSHDERKQVEKKLEDMRSWPLFAEFGETTGWDAHRLEGLAKFLMGEAQPDIQRPKTGLIVLDFLQLVAGEERELRERIGKAAYLARQVAREHKVAVLVVSSAARDKYTALASGLKAAGMMKPNKVGELGFIARPDDIVGLGKESGEIEYAADSVTTLIKWPQAIEIPIVLCAVPKLRYGRAGWFATAFDRRRFTALPFDSVPEDKEEEAKPTIVRENEHCKGAIATDPTKKDRVSGLFGDES